MAKDKTIGVFFGGKSPEHDISIITGQLVISGLREIGYRVVPVYIDKNGSWFIGEKLGDMKVFTENKSGVFKGLNEYLIDISVLKNERLVFQKKGLISNKIGIDIAFPAFHGAFGEDGTIQGLFEMLNVPYVGCDTQSSAMSMDKVTTKQIYEASQIPTVPFLYFFFDQWKKERKKVIEKTCKMLKFNMMVKPARLGSSIGISKVRNKKELENALEVAFHYENKVLVEAAIDDLLDATVAVIGNDVPVASKIQESAYGKDFFTYEDKYIKGGGAQLGKAKKTIIIPARLDKKTTDEIRSTAIKIYQIFGCTGISRVDFLYDKAKKKFYANEINSLPGTIYHHLWKKSGIELGELLEKLIGYALEKFTTKKRVTYTFESSVLSQAGSAKLSNKLFNK